MDEQIAKLPDAPTHRASAILDAVRRELRARGGDAFLNARLLLGALQRRLGTSKGVAPPEEVVVGVLQVLGDFAGCMDEELLASVPSVFADAVPHLAKEKPRRAAAALVSSLVKRLPASAPRVAEAIVARGLRADNVRMCAAAWLFGRGGVWVAVGAVLGLMLPTRGPAFGTHSSDPGSCSPAPCVRMLPVRLHPPILVLSPPPLPHLVPTPPPPLPHPTPSGAPPSFLCHACGRPCAPCCPPSLHGQLAHAVLCCCRGISPRNERGVPRPAALLRAHRSAAVD